ncbi:hypothetical protein PL373_12710 [Tenacibaculum maritimum]|nr:hypothetical protein [Tenacibaculum maritimum]MDB0601997.1 hypothetical protein [Tenacibaculum maritimum]MDB0613236.1 hypothetical protein [Tenacibaculum maritimum]
MKEEILNRIKKLGGNVNDVKGISLQKDLESIRFELVLYPKPKEVPWEIGENTPIHGIKEFIEENKNLLEVNKDTFYSKLVTHYYKDTEENFGQVFLKMTSLLHLKKERTILKNGMVNGMKMILKRLLKEMK